MGTSLQLPAAIVLLRFLHLWYFFQKPAPSHRHWYNRFDSFAFGTLLSSISLYTEWQATSCYK
ncbi:hypothetical protein HHX47_DHR1001068 [Lentinula edodes]|nr:hypothetical protein HHX47_DHR1001068 [Lentinula edodes]